ncbi:MAG: methionine--tRNA ligase subunit beta, partial [Pirellulales bacterium]
LLTTAGFSLPKQVHIHGFLTVDGENMSQRKGTFGRAATYLQHLDPAYLRYFYATKLGSRLDDLDMGLDEFISKVNTDLVGKVVNLASRTARFVAQGGLSATYPDDGGLFANAAAAGEEIAAAYDACDYNKAMRLIMGLADPANKYVEGRAPWVLAKTADSQDELRDVCTVALNLFRQLAIYLAPVLPRLAEQTGKLLNAPIGHWNDSRQPLVGTAVGPFEHMLKRVETKQVQAMIDASKEESPGAAAPAAEQAPAQAPEQTDGPQALTAEPLAETVSFDEFAKVDLRVARIIAAEEVAKSKKLLRLTVSLGGEERRNVFAGIKGVYTPEKLVGRLVILAANLAPRQMTFGLSEGMLLAAGPGGQDIFLLSPDSGAVPGQRVH